MKGYEKPKDSEEFKQDQRNPAYRKAVKQWIERGMSRYASRYVARAEARKPSTGD